MTSKPLEIIGLSISTGSLRKYWIMLRPVEIQNVAFEIIIYFYATLNIPVTFGKAY